MENKSFKFANRISLKLGVIAFTTLGVLYFSSWAVAVTHTSEAQTVQDFQRYTDKYKWKLKKVERLLPEQKSKLNVPSLSAAIGYKGELIWAGATGYKNVTKKLPADTQTKYRIGSISKSLTATALAILTNQKKVDLDQPIKKYLPNLPIQHHDTTLRQLASHTSGIRHYGFTLTSPFNEFLLNKRFNSVEESLELFINDSLSFEPGTDYQYSSFGYTLLSAVMESAAGDDFPSLIDNLVISPLAMTNTEIESKISEQHNIASNYARQFLTDTLKQAIEIDSSYKWAAGGYLGTPSDLVKLGNAWISGESTGNGLMPNSVREQFLTIQHLTNGEKSPDFYALGWRVQKVGLINGKDKTTLIFHDGKIQGGTSFLVMIPEYEIVIAMVTNSEVGSPMDLPYKSFQLARLFMKSN